MKHLFMLVVAIVVLTACQNLADTATAKDSTTNSNHLPDTTIHSADSVKTVVLYDGMHCFIYAKNRDTIYMQLALKDSLATGELIYNFYEKDRNKGIFKGRLRNDTLLGDYTFSSEGMRSVRQVIFLLKGDILLQGSGSMKEQNGRLMFSNKGDISFDGNTILEPANCDSFSSK